jgi:hypothetical protein
MEYDFDYMKETKPAPVITMEVFKTSKNTKSKDVKPTIKEPQLKDNAT